ncbi:unnamed protein product [Staurois parvus]|uniref:Secreted protein n=1 Tax=Staurois parvus TaxID=386267 RepID=A0ABN9AZV9_9NEOB|nr:unnamed protein product [Staurois parvus]
MILTLLTPASLGSLSHLPVSCLPSLAALLFTRSGSSLGLLRSPRAAARLLLSKLHLLAGDWPPVCLS